MHIYILNVLSSKFSVEFGNLIENFKTLLQNFSSTSLFRVI